jgi:hypothetical protein
VTFYYFLNPTPVKGLSTIYFLAIQVPPSVSLTDTVSGTCHTWTSLDIVKFRFFGVAARSAHQGPGGGGGPLIQPCSGVPVGSDVQ